MSRLIEVRRLRFQYPDGTLALDGIDFYLDADESVALFGANGSGKTTFLLHLNGLLHGEGEVIVCGVPVTQNNLAFVRQKVGIVFQDPDEQLFMPTVLEDVAFGLLNHGVEPSRAMSMAKAALAEVGMESVGDKAPYHLSAGEKRRVALAGVLVMKPDILVLDEPTTYLDPPARKSLIRLLRGLPQTKIIATHDTAFARSVVDRAVFFQHGKIAGIGTVQEIAERFCWDTRYGTV